MGVRRARVLWLLAWCGPALLVAFGVVAWYGRAELHPFDAGDFENTYANLVFGSMLPLLGALILSRIPRQPMGWVFLGGGLASALTMVVYPYADLANARGWPAAVLAAWVSEWIWGLGLIPIVTIGILLFPDGRPPGRRWRWLLAGDVASVALVFVGNAFHPGRMENITTLDNPVGLPVPDAAAAAVLTTGMALFVLGFFGGVAAAVVRWRRATGVERAPLSWFALACALVAAALFLPLQGRLNDVVLVVTVPLLPVSVAVAILRHHLYGIEVAVRRSLVFGVLTAILLLGYSATVTVLGAVLGGHAGATATLVATALVAVAFAPLRLRVQRAVDRLLYGDRRDPYAVLTGLGRRLDVSDELDPLREVATTLATSLRLPYVRIEVDGAEPLVAEHGDPVPNPHVVPLTYRGAPVGRLSVGARGPADPFRPADLRLLDDLGRQVGVTAHATQLATDLQRSREQLVATREEERRRLRRDLHDGLGPALAGIALGLDAVHRVAPQDAAAAARLADELKHEVKASLADVRRVVDDLRPAALDQLGLVGAIRQQAQQLTDRDPGLAVSVEADVSCALPAAVEIAAYRITAEALNNVARHAGARECRVALALDAGGFLEVEVEDDGIGLPATPGPGVGLNSMRERVAELGGSWRVLPGARGGTRVEARLPVVSG